MLGAARGRFQWHGYGRVSSSVGVSMPRIYSLLLWVSISPRDAVAQMFDANAIAV